MARTTSSSICVASESTLLTLFTVTVLDTPSQTTRRRLWSCFYLAVHAFTASYRLIQTTLWRFTAKRAKVVLASLSLHTLCTAVTSRRLSQPVCIMTGSAPRTVKVLP